MIEQLPIPAAASPNIAVSLSAVRQIAHDLNNALTTVSGSLVDTSGSLTGTTGVLRTILSSLRDTSGVLVTVNGRVRTINQVLRAARSPERSEPLTRSPPAGGARPLPLGEARGAGRSPEPPAPAASR